MKINYGCGNNKIVGYVNIDTNPALGDLVCDATKEKLPVHNDTVEVVCAFHVIEHVRYEDQPTLLTEFYRVLIPGGKLRISYPEFSICAKHFVENYRGMRSFWRTTLYGRQLYPGDYHVTPMDTGEFCALLNSIGFKVEKAGPEIHEPHNSIVEAIKESKLDYEAALAQSLPFPKQKDTRFKIK